MSSPQKRQANRLNAQRSTGPKSSRGRRVSSLNALRHGLSRPIDQAMQAPIIAELGGLIQAEGIGTIEARYLATKILDYERNIAREFEGFPPYQSPLPRAPDEIMAMVREDWPEMDMLDDIADDELFFTGSLSKRTFKTNLRLKTKIIKLWFQKDAKTIRRQRQMQASADRYLRRASNQLIKSLRAAVR